LNTPLHSDHGRTPGVQAGTEDAALLLAAVGTEDAALLVTEVGIEDAVDTRQVLKKFPHQE
jgi:hypothetical protein